MEWNFSPVSQFAVVLGVLATLGPTSLVDAQDICADMLANSRFRCILMLVPAMAHLLSTITMPWIAKLRNGMHTVFIPTPINIETALDSGWI